MRLFACLALTAAVAASVPAADKGVTIKGQITLTDAPKPEVLNVTADKPVCCKNGDLLSNKVLVNPKTHGIQNVVVYLRPDDDDRDAKFPADKVPAAKPTKVVVDQPNCQFEPRVLVARDGDKLLVKNSATIPHNIKIEGCGLSLNQLIPAGGEKEIADPLKADRTGANFECNIHPWMGGKLFVFDHPYYAITDADGKFEIKNVPAGKYRIVYRHENGFHKGKDGRLGFPIEVKDGGTGTMEIKAFDIELPK